MTENSRVKPDTAMGVIFSGMFALGIVAYTAIRTEVHLDHILFGHMLGVLWEDVAETAVIAALALLIIAGRRRDLMVFAFDAQHARAVGLPVRVLHYGLLTVISMVVVAALKAVGLILAIAFLIGPGATAHLLSRRFERMMLTSVGVAVTACVAGLILSFYAGADPAASIVVVMTVQFLAAMGWTTLRHRAKAA